MFKRKHLRTLLGHSYRRKFRIWIRQSSGLVPFGLFALLLLTVFASFASSGPSSTASLGEVVQCECVDGRGNRQSRSFLKQDDFDTCDVTCDSNGVFTSTLDEASVIGKGYSDLQGSRVEMCMLCRDAEASLANISRRIVQLSKHVRTIHVTFIENDSVDDTRRGLRNILLNLMNSSTNIEVSIESHSLKAQVDKYGSRKFPPARVYDSAAFEYQRAVRYHRMSILRNRCLHEVMKRPDTDFLFVNDADEDLNTEKFQMDGIAHSIGLRGTEFDWKVVCANGVGVPKRGKIPRLKMHRNITEPIPKAALNWVFWDSLAYRDNTYNKTSWRTHQLRIHSMYDVPLKVESCFGGLAIYYVGASTEWHKCSYAGHTDNDCEHVSFNNCLRKHGWTVLFNPRMVVNYVRP